MGKSIDAHDGNHAPVQTDIDIYLTHGTKSVKLENDLRERGVHSPGIKNLAKLRGKFFERTTKKDVVSLLIVLKDDFSVILTDDAANDNLVTGLDEDDIEYLVELKPEDIEKIYLIKKRRRA